MSELKQCPRCNSENLVMWRNVETGYYCLLCDFCGHVLNPNVSTGKVVSEDNKKKGLIRTFIDEFLFHLFVWLVVINFAIFYPLIAIYYELTDKDILHNYH